jgi:hypothetical protein
VGFVDEVVHGVEQVVQLRLGERSPSRRDCIVGSVLGGVPLEANLRRDIAELVLAERNPSVSAVSDITSVDSAIGVCRDLRSARN